MTDRRTELATSLAELRERVRRACDAADRDPAEITLVAVTKTFPASDVRLLAGLGVADVGENRDAEASAKHAECADLALTWHFVGQLQRRKAASVARYADVVHSLDRPELADSLGRQAVAAGREIAAMVQIGLDGDSGGSTGRGGVPPRAAVELATRVATTPGLVLAGVMAVAPTGIEPGPAFARLSEVSAQVKASFPDARAISAGMSGDLEAAVRYGATHLRVGTALLGGRTPPVG
jgi:hypothetical protein